MITELDIEHKEIELDKDWVLVTSYRSFRLQLDPKDRELIATWCTRLFDRVIVLEGVIYIMI